MADTELSAFEKALIAASALVTLALFGYLAYESATTPPDPLPELRVEPAEAGAWVVLANGGGSGIGEALVVATCGEDELDITFTHVPAASARRAFVPCEAGGVAAEIAWWTRA